MTGDGKGNVGRVRGLSSVGVVGEVDDEGHGLHQVVVVASCSQGCVQEGWGWADGGRCAEHPRGLP